MNSEFINAVKTKDKEKIKSEIINSFIVDFSAKETESMCQFIEKENIGSEIYEVSDGKDLFEDESYWTKDYLKLLLNDLRYNFAKERINLLIKVTRYVYCEYIQQEATASESEQKSNRAVRTTRPSYGGTATRRGSVTYKRNSSPLPYVSIGGAVVAAIGWVTSSTVVTVIGGALCIGGVVGYIMTKK